MQSVNSSAASSAATSSWLGQWRPNKHLLEGWGHHPNSNRGGLPRSRSQCKQPCFSASLQGDWEWFHTRMEEPGEGRRSEVLSKIFLLSKVKAESESFVKSSILLIVYVDFCQCLRRPWGRKYSPKWINIEISSLLLQLKTINEHHIIRLSLDAV